MPPRAASDDGRGVKAPGAFRTISEVAEDLDVPQHVLRFWESKFVQVKPLKRGGGRRYYRPEDVALLKGIRHLLYSDGYTIKGVQKVLRENGAGAVVAAAKPLAERLAEHRAEAPPPVAAADEGPQPFAEAVAKAAPASPAPAASAEVELARLKALVRDLRGELAALRALLAAPKKD